MYSRSLAEVIALFFFPLSFTRELWCRLRCCVFFCPEELLIKTQMLARLHERLCKEQAEVPGHMNLTRKDKTDPFEAETAPKSLNDHSNVFITGAFTCGVPCLSLRPSLLVMYVKVLILEEAEEVLSGRSTVVNFLY